LIAAVDAGGTYLKAGLVGDDGEIVEGSLLSRPSDSNGDADRILARLAECLSALLDSARRHDASVTGFAFAYPGPFDYAGGRSLMRHKYPSVYGVPLISAVSRLLRLPDVPTLFCHDIHAFAFGVYSSGEAGEAKSLFCVSIGTGVGTGWIQNGRIVAGDDGGPKWSIYSRPYSDGTLEDVVSARGIMRRYRELVGGDVECDPETVALKARDGDIQAAEVYRELGSALGHIIQPILKEIEADVLLFGGKIALALDLFAPALEDALLDLPNLSIRAAADPDIAALKGAAALLRTKLSIDA